MTTARTRALRRSAGWNAAVWDRHTAYWPIRVHAAPFVTASAFPSVAAIDEALAPAARVRFATQEPPRRRERGVPPPVVLSYDACIVERGEVPTREGSWHDLMNALVWAAFPETKRVVHTRQHAFIAEERRLGRPGMRLPPHDALAILDEGGVCVVTRDVIEETTDALAAALLEKRARAFVFGHAIYETLALGGPWPLVRGVVIAANEQMADLADSDNLVAAADRILAKRLTTDDYPATPKHLVCLPPQVIATHL